MEGLLKSGQRLNKRYRIKGWLAGGGFGHVYEALDETMERTVALKHVFAQLDTAYLRRETIILAQHAEKLRFIPNVYDHWKDSKVGGYMIVMEFIEGKMLNDESLRPWSSAAVIEFLRIMLRCLHDLHERAIVHCDIKPINIKKIPPSGLFYNVPYMLLDFGIAKQANETTIIASSKYYSAPEQDPRCREVVPAMKVGAHTDLYGLAATAYTLLTNIQPVDAVERFMIVEAKAPDPLQPLSKLRDADLPVGLEKTLLALLQVRPEQRPGDACEALQLLNRNLEQNLPDASLASAGVEPTAPVLVLNPVPSPLTDPAAAPARPASSPAPAEVPAVTPRLIQGPANPQPAWAAMATPADEAVAELQARAIGASAAVQSIALLPDGRTLATFGQGLQRWTIDDDGLIGGVPLDLGCQRPRAIAASPDGQQLAVVNGDEVQLRSAVSGELLRRWMARPAQARDLCFSADDGSLLLIEADGIARFAASADDPVERITLGERRQIDHVVLSASGSHVALHSDGDLLVSALRGESAPHQIALPAGEDVTALALSADGSRLATASFGALMVWALGRRSVKLLGRRSLPRQSHLHALKFGGAVLAARQRGEARFWHVSDSGLDPLGVASSHRGWIVDLVVAPDGAGAITASRDGTLQVWGIAE